MFRGDRRACAALILRATASEFDVDRLAGVATGLQVTSDVERVVWEGAGRDDEVAERDIAWGRRRTEADGVERHSGLAGGFDRGAGLDAGILGAVGHDDDSSERCIVIKPQLVRERLTQSSFGAARLQYSGPVNGFFLLLCRQLRGRVG